MAAIAPVPAQSRLLMSGNEAVARAVWEAGVKVAAAYPGTPATEMLEVISTYPDLYAEWSVNEKVSLEVAFGAAMAGSRAFCAMKHVGMNVASDALMTMTLTGVAGGLVIAIADDVGLSSSQNEQDSRYWGRFANVPVLEPADSQEAYDYTLAAFALSEKFQVPVILRLTTRICHVKALVTVGERVAHAAAGFEKDAARWVMVPASGAVTVVGGGDCRMCFFILPTTCISQGRQSKRSVYFSPPDTSVIGSARICPCTPVTPLACLGHRLRLKRTQCLVIIRLTSPSSSWLS